MIGIFRIASSCDDPRVLVFTSGVTEAQAKLMSVPNDKSDGERRPRDHLMTPS